MAASKKANNGHSVRVAMYIRVSTEEQAKEGFSIPAQRERLHAFCQSQGWEIVDEYIEEGYSAKDMERPQLKRLLRDVERGIFDIVLVYRLDRLTRSVLDLYTILQLLENNNVAFRSATEVYDTTTAIGRLFITLVAALAQWERENLAERTKYVMEQMALDGIRPGGPAPYGYKSINGQLVVDPKQARVVRNIFQWYSQGKGLPTIQKLLLEKNVKSPSGNEEWNQEYIRYMLSNPAYTGFVRWEGKPAGVGKYEAIIDQSLYNRVQEIKEQKSIESPSEIKGKYPLSGTLICGHCGAKMSGKLFKRTPPAEPVVYYRCSRKTQKGGCVARYIRQDEIEPEIIDYLDELFNNEEELKKVVEEQMNQIPEEIDESEELIEELTKELESVSKQKNKWYSLFNDPDNPIPREDLFAQIRPLTERENAIHEQLSQLKKRTETHRPSILKTYTLYKDIKNQWNRSEPEERKQMLKDIFEYIKVYNDYTIRYKFK